MNPLRNLGRRLVPFTVRCGARRLTRRLRAGAALGRLWHWEVISLSAEPRPYRVVWVGLHEQRSGTSDLLNLERGEARTTPPRITRRTAVVSSAPLPRALRVPLQVHMVVPLDATLDRVTERFDAQLRKRLKSQRPRYTSVHVTRASEVDVLTETMLRPYASARHGDEAQEMSPATVRRFATNVGRLDLLCRDGTPVGCRVGYPHAMPDGTRSWVLWRLGYPREVFEDGRQLGDVNAMNVYVDLERVMAEGHDSYDLGSCIAQPHDGLLQWKRRRGGTPTAYHSDEWLSVLLPRRGAAQLLWDAPLLAAEEGHLSLWLGLPVGHTDDELLDRCKGYRFDGLKRVHLACEREPDFGLLASLGKLYDGFGRRPELAPRRVAA